MKKVQDMKEVMPRFMELEKASIDTAVDRMIRWCRDAEEEIRKLKEENKRLKSEHYESEELKKMQEIVEKTKADALRGFPVTEGEREEIERWKEEHRKEKEHKWTEFSYIFTETALGDFATVQCSCGKEFCFRR